MTANGARRKDYGWLKERYTLLMGRRPEEKDLARLMRVKDLLEIDYDDPALMQLLAFEYYGQLYEEMPQKIREVVAETEAHASKHFEERAIAIVEAQTLQLNRAVARGMGQVLEKMGEEGKRALSTFMEGEFARTTKPEFLKAAREAENAAENIKDFARLFWRFMFGTSVAAGLVSAAVVWWLTQLYK